MVPFLGGGGDIQKVLEGVYGVFFAMFLGETSRGCFWNLLFRQLGRNNDSPNLTI